MPFDRLSATISNIIDILDDSITRRASKWARDFCDFLEGSGPVTIPAPGFRTAGKTINAEYWVNVFRHKQCYNPINNIYSIHSLLMPELRDSITIDYSLTTEVVAHSFVKAIIETTNDPSILCGSSQNHEEDGITGKPSWLPDLLRPELAKNQRGTFHNAMASGSLPIYHKFSQNHTLLTVKGLRMGIVHDSAYVDMVSEPGYNFIRQGPSNMLHYMEVLNMSQPIPAIMVPELCTEEPELEIINGLLREKREWSDEEFYLCRYGLSIIWRMISGRPLFAFLPSEVIRQTYDTVDNSNRHFGIGSGTMQPGDVVCIVSRNTQVGHIEASTFDRSLPIDRRCICSWLHEG